MNNFYKLLLFTLIFNFVSCDSDEEIYITGITYTNNIGNQSTNKNEIDGNDWNLNYTFKNVEKLLFDTLDFSKTAVAETQTVNGIQYYPQIVFFPNPVNNLGNISYYSDKHILNLIIIDKKMNKLYQYRISNSSNFNLNFSELDKGLFRMYYVIQDSQYRIVHTGYGDILKE